MLSHGSKGDKDRWNLLSPTSKSLAKEFDFGDATKGGVGGVVKGKDRWNLLRDNVQSVSLQAGSLCPVACDSVCPVMSFKGTWCKCLFQRGTV